MPIVSISMDRLLCSLLIAPKGKKRRTIPISFRRLMAIPGVGPLTATAVVASIGNGAEFRKGRSFAAWLGLVPEQRSTGGKQKLLGISKHGNPYLRKLLVHGARAVLQCRDKQSPSLSAWLCQLAARAHINIVAVALANKMARIVWAVLSKGEAYRPPLLAGSIDAVAC
jgi:transposase